MDGIGVSGISRLRKCPIDVSRSKVGVTSSSFGGRVIGVSGIRVSGVGVSGIAVIGIVVSGSSVAVVGVVGMIEVRSIAVVGMVGVSGGDAGLAGAGMVDASLLSPWADRHGCRWASSP